MSIENATTTQWRHSLWIALLAIVLLAGIARIAYALNGPGRGYEHIPAGAFSVVAQVRAKPGKEAELRAATLPLIAKVRAEAGNLVYFLQEDRDAPGHFIFYEIFTTREAFDAHNRTPHVEEWFAKLPALADGGVTVLRMQTLETPGTR